MSDLIEREADSDAERSTRDVGTDAFRMRSRRIFGRSLTYGFAAQIFSSATNLELAIIAGHILGPAGLGSIYIGFAAYISLLVVQRALVTEPLLATSSSLDTGQRAATARHALTITLVGAIGTTVLLAGVGMAIPSQFGRGMLLFAPFITPAVVQDLGRSTVFRDQRGVRTVLSDLCWLVLMTALAPLAFLIRSDWAVVGVWGVGSVVGAGVALSLVRQAPSPLKAAIRWWRGEPWQLGRWLGLQATLRSVAAYTWVLSLAGILGTAEYGGLRAVNVVFAPLSLLGPAIALPGLPMISRIVTSSPRRALKMAAQSGDS